jgi:hypothetical protein
MSATVQFNCATPPSDSCSAVLRRFTSSLSAAVVVVAAAMRQQQTIRGARARQRQTSIATFGVFVNLAVASVRCRHGPGISATGGREAGRQLHLQLLHLQLQRVDAPLELDDDLR